MGDRRGDLAAALGGRARWRLVGYAGRAHAPASCSYAGINPVGPKLTTVADSGRVSGQRVAFAILHPLIAAALYETAFASEAGPLTTWSS